MCRAVLRTQAHWVVYRNKVPPVAGSGGYLLKVPSCFTRRLLMFVVVLGAIDLAGLAILLAVGLGALLVRQLAPVGLPLGANLLVDSCLISFQMSSLSFSQLAAFDTIR